MLINTCITQIVIALLLGFLQGRLLAVSSGTAFLPVGPCRVFGPFTCFATFNVITALTLYVELLTVHTMFYRYRMLRSSQMTTAKLVPSFVVVAVLSIILLVCWKHPVFCNSSPLEI
ncbi:hypothetical protein COOONC_04748 [Cooperia oncophora]